MNKKNPNLTAEQKLVMFEDGTEAPGTSELNNEKRDGSYHCANCGIKLFESNYSEPVNIGSDEQVSINQMIDILEEISENKDLPSASI